MLVYKLNPLMWFRKYSSMLSLWDDSLTPSTHVDTKKEERPINAIPASEFLTIPRKSSSTQDYKFALGEAKIFDSPITMVCSKIGASLGVFVWDPSTSISGGAYVIWSGKAEPNAPDDVTVVDSIHRLLEDFRKVGSSLQGLRAKIVGGSDIFSFGKKNVECVKRALDRYHVKIEAADVGGDYCRTARFSSDTNLLLVKTSQSNYYRIY